MASTTGNNRLTQQRVHIIPSKNMAFFDDDDVDDDGTSSMGYSFTSSVYGSVTADDTFALAEFLSTTSPDEFAKPSSKKKLQQQYRASRLLSKLRKRGAITNTTNVTTTDANSIKSNTTNDTVSKGPTSTTARKHIPLPEYHPPPQPEITTLYQQQQQQQQQQTKKQSYRLTTMSSTSSSSTNTTPSLSSNHHHHHQQYSPSLRDSGVYSEISDKDYIPPPPPVPPPPVPTLDLFPKPPPSIPAKSTARPRRPAPLPADVASAAIHAALRNVPEAALRRQSVIRQQHYQQQQQSSGSGKAQQQEKEQELRTGACPHCRQHISSNSFNGKEKDDRRLSCPPALATGELLIKNTNESNLRQMILQLEKQLADERLSRKKLEQAISRQHHQAVINKQEEVAEERDRWKGESLWMENRIASLPE